MAVGHRLHRRRSSGLPVAGAGPALKQVDYSLHAGDLKIVKGETGNLTAVDDDGNRVFRAPPAQMWDSSGDARTAGPEDAPGAQALGAAPRTTGGGA